MTAEHIFGGLYLLAIGALLWERRKKPGHPLSACDEAVVLAIRKLLDAERFVPPGSGFTCQGAKSIMFKGERFRVIVERERTRPQLAKR